MICGDVCGVGGGKGGGGGGGGGRRNDMWGSEMFKVSFK